MKKKKRLKKKYRIMLGCLAVFFPAAIVVTTLAMILFSVINSASIFNTIKETPQQIFEIEVPEDYIPYYKEAAETYNIPWTLLAAHHRVETKFSRMDPLLSPVGAEGHMQFMPCTFVGWSHPTCSGLGEGDIPEEEKTDPAVIALYGGYGVDGNQDGVADPFNLIDALYSAANYLSKNGAADGDLEQAIFQYNHSDAYVEDILKYYHMYEEKFQGQ